MNFSVGQKIVCINSFKNISVCGLWSIEIVPTVDNVYTVSGNNDDFGVRLSEFDYMYIWNKNKFVPLEDWNKASEAVEELMISINEPVKQ